MAEVYSKVIGPNLTGRERLMQPGKITRYWGWCKANTDELKSVRYWIDCGDDDPLSKGNPCCI